MERHDSWESDVPSTATNSAPLVVKIAGGCGLVACLLLIWHFAFSQPVPVAPATATFVTQPPVQPVVPIQPVTPVPVTPQPPTTPVTPPAKSVNQPLPPKPIANWKGWPKDTPLPAIAPFNAEQAKQHQEAWAKHLGVPVEYTNSIGMKFRLIPPGEFLMGSTAAESDALKGAMSSPDLPFEMPQHVVTVTAAFYLGIHEVTQKQYLTVMGINPSFFTRTGGGKGAIGDADTSDLPVDTVSWLDAGQFCTKLSEREKLAPFDLNHRGPALPTGNGYRLPSEAQWEFACRAGTLTRYWTGDSESDIRRAGVFTSRATGKVGQLAANAFGLFDVHGNVWEWCLDGWNPDAYQPFRNEVAVDPLTPWTSAPNRVLRGAHFYYGSTNGRSARRGNAPRAMRYLDHGFRAVLSVAGVRAALANPVKAEAEPDDKQNAASTWKGWSKDAPPPAIAPFNAEQAKQHQEAWAKHLGVPVEYTNSIGMKFRLIPPGEFMMGSTAGEVAAGLKAVEQTYWPDCVRSESPRHKVVLTQPVYFAIHEVTQANYKTVMDTNPAYYAATGRAPRFVTRVAGMDTNQFPVEGINWYDSAEFCTKLSLKEKIEPAYLLSGMVVTFLNGAGYRLPTEAEWEFACRAGTTTMFSTGDSEPQLTAAAWTANNSGFRPHAVGELSANPFGLHDMHGNVWEILQDWWGPTWYTQFKDQLVEDPTGPMDDGVYRISRGGSFLRTPAYARSAFRGYVAPPTKNETVGFRVTLSVAAVKAALANPVKAETEPEHNRNAVSTWKGWPKDAPAPAIAPFNAEQAKQHQEAWAKHLGVPVEYTNSIGMKFRLIPPGEFLMGSPSERMEAELKSAGSNPTLQAALRGQVPQHKVILTQPIYLGVHEVTQGHYETVTGNKPSHFAATGTGREAVNGLETTQHPVEFVSWLDVAEFCAKLSEREKLKPFDFQSGKAPTQQRNSGYRLPTEAEWERACRAGTVTTFWPGNTDAELLRAGWFEPNSKRRTHAVGELRANSFGLHDVHGNVWEWVLDEVDLNYYQQFEKEPAVDPTGPTPMNTRRGVRGGSWQYLSRDCWASYRHSIPAAFRHRNIGFRVALSVDAVKSSLAKPLQAEMPLEATRKRLVRVTQATQDDSLSVSFRGHEHAVLSLAVSPDGKSLASGDLYGSVMVWNVADRKLRFELPGTAGENIVGLAYSPDGKLIATGNGKSVKLWDAANGQELKAFNGHTDLIWSVAFSPDNKRLASGSHDKSVKVWGIVKGEEITTLTGKDSAFLSVAFSLDGKWLAGSTSCGESYVMLWDRAVLRDKQHATASHRRSSHSRQDDRNHESELDTTSSHNFLGFKNETIPDARAIRLMVWRSRQVTT